MSDSNFSKNNVSIVRFTSSILLYSVEVHLWESKHMVILSMEMIVWKSGIRTKFHPPPPPPLRRTKSLPQDKISPRENSYISASVHWFVCGAYSIWHKGRWFLTKMTEFGDFCSSFSWRQIVANFTSLEHRTLQLFKNVIQNYFLTC